MSLRRVTTAAMLALVALGGVAFAARPSQTRVQLALVPVVGTCHPGGDCTNGHPNVGVCAIDGGDCDLGTLSMRSKLSLNGDLILTVAAKGVTNVDGELVTTDGTEGSPDDYIVKLTLRPCSTSCDPSDLYLKLDLKKGKGALKVDLRAIFVIPPPAGTPFGVEQGRLYVAAVNPLDCPGANTGAAILARRNDGDCETGGFIAHAGVVLR